MSSLSQHHPVGQDAGVQAVHRVLHPIARWGRREFEPAASAARRSRSERRKPDAANTGYARRVAATDSPARTSDAITGFESTFADELTPLTVEWRGADVPDPPRLLVVNEKLAASLGLDVEACAPTMELRSWAARRCPQTAERWRRRIQDISSAGTRHCSETDAPSCSANSSTPRGIASIFS